MKKIAFKNSDITNPEELFGRKELLNILYDHAERLDQVQVIGARRFGKTCILKSLHTKLKSPGNHNAYPVYLDLKSNDIKGTANVYRYIASVIISDLFMDRLINDSVIEYSNISIIPSASWRKVYKQFRIDADVDDITDFFESIVCEYSELLEETFLLLFDEYEYMAKDAFDRINGFMLIRSICDMGSRPLSFWISGASPWEKFILENKNESVGGSGEFNTVTISKYIKPIDYESFKLMWHKECDYLNFEEDKLRLKSLCNDVFNASGGIPFFAKSIGAYLCVNHNFPHFDLLKGQIEEIEKTLEDGEKRTLRDIQQGTKIYQEPLASSVINLLNYGLITISSKGKATIPIGMYSDFIKSEIAEFLLKSVPRAPELIQKVDIISELIYAINENHIRQYGDAMFDISNDMELQYKCLRTKCNDRGKFANFIDAMYLIYWEGAKKNGQNGEKLPGKFKGSSFRRALDRLRHTFGQAHQQDKLDKFPGQLDKGAALNYFT